MKPLSEESHGLKDVLSFLMDECDVDDATLSRETGVPASSISRMRLNAEANPTASTLRPIAKFFSVSISQLLGDEALPEDRLPGTHNPIGFTSLRMPVIDWGCIMDWLDNEGKNTKNTLKQWISTEKDIGEKSFALVIGTNAFGLAFRKGSLIIVDPDQNPCDGDLVLIKLQGEHNIFLKQFLLDGSDRYVRSVNPEMKATKQVENKDRIIGVVIETRYSLQEREKEILLKKGSLSKAFSEDGCNNLA
ncbi:TPA: S24 family peptidase [Legionella feeleii]